MQELLGKGSYAEVRKAMHINTGVVRAVKIIDRVKHSKI
jgi:serine/threonine protein kinase